jgi:hypothetical protein
MIMIIAVDLARAVQAACQAQRADDKKRFKLLYDNE